MKSIQAHWAQPTTFHVETGAKRKRKTRSLLNLQPLYIPVMDSNVTLQKSYHSPLNCLKVTQAKQHEAKVQSHELRGEKSSCSFPI